MKPYLMTKLKNDVSKLQDRLEFTLKNVSVNGNKFGCSGFIYDTETGKAIYVSTDHNHGINYNKALLRTVDAVGNYGGSGTGINNFTTYKSLPEAIVELLKKGTVSGRITRF